MPKKQRSTGPRDRSRALRLEREQAAAALRARRVRRVVIASVILAAMVLATFIDVRLHQPTAGERELLAAAPTARNTAGCAGVTVVAPYPGGQDRTHVQDLPALSSYPSVPPASGPHNPVPLDAGVYATPPPIGNAIHSLEHAAVIIWYDPAAASSGELTRIQQFFARAHERNHVIIAPYNYPQEGPAGSLPSGRQMALVAWHHLQLCDQPSLSVAFAFVHSYRFNLYQRGSYRGDAPEKYTPI